MTFHPDHGGVSRESLRDGSFLDRFRADPPRGIRVPSDVELEASLEATLSVRRLDQDIHLFGYGSLMWNPSIRHVGRYVAELHGWSRRFCLWMRMGRGSEEEPGLMLGLDSTGDDRRCVGVAYRLDPAIAKEELMLVWRREMFSGAYQPKWLDATVEGRTVQVLAFVVDRNNERYVNDLTSQQTATYITTGRGALGTCLAYFKHTLASLRELGVIDGELERIQVHIT